MEATKKKKAYLKPEMNRFEMKMEGTFMAASRVPENVEVLIQCINVKNNSYLLGGSWSSLSEENFNKCVHTQFSNDSSPHSKDLEDAGFLVGDCIIARRATSSQCPTTGDIVSILVKRVPCEGFTVGDYDCQ